jgi:hypothetical protein
VLVWCLQSLHVQKMEAAGRLLASWPSLLGCHGRGVGCCRCKTEGSLFAPAVEKKCSETRGEKARRGMQLLHAAGKVKGLRPQREGTSKEITFVKIGKTNNKIK